MNWPLGKVSDIGEVISGFAFKSEWFGVGNAKVIRIGDLQDGKVDLADAETFDESAHQVREQFKIKNGDILMALSGATVGKIAVADTSIEGAYLNQRVAVVRGKCPANTEYLKYVFSGSLLQKLLINAGGAAQPNLSPKDLGDMEIPIPPLEEQKRIAAILDKADAIRRKRQQAIKLADDFLRSVFLEMFGDPVTNPKRWDIEYLPNIGAFKNGLNYGKNESGVSVSCLGVGDFKSLDRIDNVQLLSKINLDSVPSDEYLLRDGDLVFVRSNGNGALVGRCLSVWPGSEKLTFSGFCIRFRAIKNGVSSDYLNHLFRMPSIKHEMLKGGQGANIQNINQQKLSEIKVPIPPEQLQVKFSNVVNAFRDALDRNCSSLDEIQSLFSSLSQKAFSGNL